MHANHYNKQGELLKELAFAETELKITLEM